MDRKVVERTQHPTDRSRTLVLDDARAVPPVGHRHHGRNLRTRRGGRRGASHRQRTGVRRLAELQRRAVHRRVERSHRDRTVQSPAERTDRAPDPAPGRRVVPGGTPGERPALARTRRARHDPGERGRRWHRRAPRPAPSPRAVALPARHALHRLRVGRRAGIERSGRRLVALDARGHPWVPSSPPWSS